MIRRDFLKTALAAGTSGLLSPRLWAFEPVSVANPLGVLPLARLGEGLPRPVPLRLARSPGSVHRTTRTCAACGPSCATASSSAASRTTTTTAAATCTATHATKAWNPRGCPKGFTMHRRVYGPYRLKRPGAAQGLEGLGRRGLPLAVRPTRTADEVSSSTTGATTRLCGSRGTRRIATSPTGWKRSPGPTAATEGTARLEKDGYDPLMIDKVEGAGTRTIKVGSNLPIHGVIGKFGIYRFANLLGLLDHHVRGVPPEQARGARDWNEYTWRGDQAPGTRSSTGLQTSDMDMNDLRFSKLVIQVGKNLIENKMPESHWLNEVMERGGKLVDIAPEYNCPGTKSELLDRRAARACPTRPSSGRHQDPARRRTGTTPTSCRRFTDFPLLVRTDTLKRLRPEEVIAGYTAQGHLGRPVLQDPGTDRRAARDDRRLLRLGRRRRQRRGVRRRDEVGENMPVAAPRWRGRFQVKLARRQRQSKSCRFWRCTSGIWRTTT